jgi:hypothetical protein
MTWQSKLIMLATAVGILAAVALASGADFYG